LLSGGGILSNRDFDRDELRPFIRTTYEFSPGYTTFLRASYDERSYALTVDRSGTNRDSSGASVDAGLDVAITNLVKGQLFGGYLHQQFKSAFEDFSGFDYGAALDWTPTSEVRVNLTASRTLNPTVLVGVSISDDQQIGASINYAFLREVSIQGGIRYTDSVFRGSSREDRLTEATVGLSYFMNRYLTVNALYVLGHRDSSFAGQGFRDDTVSVTLTGRL
jgi:hypothetical protein